MIALLKYLQVHNRSSCHNYTEYNSLFPVYRGISNSQFRYKIRDNCQNPPWNVESDDPLLLAWWHWTLDHVVVLATRIGNPGYNKYRGKLLIPNMMSSRQAMRRGMFLPRQNIARQGVPLLTRKRAYATAQSRTLEEESTMAEADLESPQLPNISRQYLPPKGWHDDLMRRNVGDPVRFSVNGTHLSFTDSSIPQLHEQEELYSMWGPDIPPNSISPYTALWHFVIAATGIVGVGFLIKALGPDPPAVRRQYPYDGLVKELGGLQENKVFF